MFLQTHPLHKYYGGENAFKQSEYVSAIKGSGLQLQKILKHYESVINYFPEKEEDVINLPVQREKKLIKWKNKLGFIGKIPVIFRLLAYLINLRSGGIYDGEKYTRTDE